MIMFVLREDNSPFFNFNIDHCVFKVGDIVEHESLHGKHKVIFTDSATVTVKPLV